MRDIGLVSWVGILGSGEESQHLGGEGNDLHEVLFAEFAGDGTEDPGPARVVIFIDDDDRVPVEPEVNAIAATLLSEKAREVSLFDCGAFPTVTLTASTERSVSSSAITYTDSYSARSCSSVAGDCDGGRRLIWSRCIAAANATAKQYLSRQKLMAYLRDGKRSANACTSAMNSDALISRPSNTATGCSSE